jgi:5-formyltetrahydrofolate cyclo-ligase
VLKIGYVASIIAQKLFERKEYQQAKRISIYLSMPTAEVHTPEIVRHALGTGKRVFVPYFYSISPPTKNPDDAKPKKQMVMDMLELSTLQDYESLEPDSWGIPTPSEESIKHRANCFGGCGRSVDAAGKVAEYESGEGLDVIVTPGLGFDRERGRLGRGKGFYDRFFEKCERVKKHGARSPFKSTSVWILSCLRNGTCGAELILFCSWLVVD